jgi:hypothetical protein
VAGNKDKDGVDGLNFNSSVNRQAYLDMRRDQESRAGADNAVSSNPDSEESMNKLFAKADAQREQEVSDYRSQQQRAAYVKSQRDYFESVSEGMSAASIVERGGAQLASTTSIESGAAGIIGAGGERKGSRQTIESGAEGIVAAGGRKTGPHLGIGATFRDQYMAVKWGAGMQAYRTLGRAYQRAEREKKKNDGGLTAARRHEGGRDFFPNRPMFKVGPVTFNTMRFDGVTPIVGTYSAAEEGWPQNDVSTNPTIERSMRSAARVWRLTNSQ